MCDVFFGKRNFTARIGCYEFRSESVRSAAAQGLALGPRLVFLLMNDVIWKLANADGVKLAGDDVPRG